MKRLLSIILITALGMNCALAREIKPVAKSVAKPKKPTSAQLQHQIDSLSGLVAKYDSTVCDLRARLEVADSLVAALSSDKNSGAGAMSGEYNPAMLDSLLSVFDLQSIAANMPFVACSEDSLSKLSTALPDSIFIKRIEAMNSYITVPYNYVVKSQIITYAERNKAKMGKVLSLYNYYAPAFNEIFDKYDMPEELKCMAIIESMMNPVASSKAGAKGMWQFMYQTGKLYGLKIDSFVDERLDPFVSCDAAARYMKNSFDVFGDWSLAISAYNCGFANVRKAIKRAGGKTGFWDIYPFLPKETRGYMPAFVAALYTTAYYKEHGIELQPCGLPVQVDTLGIGSMMHFEQIHAVIGTPVKVLKDLNPQYKHNIIPGPGSAGADGYILRLPREYTDAFIEKQGEILSYKRAELLGATQIQNIKAGGDGSYIIYKVKQGDNLSTIAKKYPRVTVKDIMRFNNMSSSMLQIGQKLRIPIK